MNLCSYQASFDLSSDPANLHSLESLPCLRPIRRPLSEAGRPEAESGARNDNHYQPPQKRATDLKVSTVRRLLDLPGSPEKGTGVICLTAGEGKMYAMHDPFFHSPKDSFANRHTRSHPHEQ